MTPSDSNWHDTVVRALTVVLAAALVASLVGVVALAAAPPTTTEPTTEFYLLDGNRTTADYPTELAPEAPALVWVGIANHEQQPIEYQVSVAWNGTVSQSFSATLPAGYERLTPVQITAPATPGEYRLEFSLAGNASVEPMVTRLSVDVGEES